jgi:hypothetical protein
MVNATFVCAILGVPEIVTELLELDTSVTPSGNAPEDTLQLKGSSPPVA